MPEDVLGVTIEANAFVDSLRLIVAFIGLVHLLFAVDRFLQHRVFWAGIAFMSTGLLTMLQQLEAIEEPLVPWRLPLYALMNMAGIVFLYRMGPDGCEADAYSTRL